MSQKLSKSKVLDLAAESETIRQLAHLHDTSRYTHFAIGTNVTMANATFLVLDRDGDALTLRHTETGDERTVRPYALARP